MSETTMETMRANRDALMNAWREQVEAAKRFGRDATTFNAVGPIWARDDSLVLFVRVDGVHAYDLRVRDGVVTTEQ